MNNSKRCRLCGDSRLIERFVLHHAPSNISRLLHRHELATDTAIDLAVYECDACGLVQLTELLEAGFYDDYVMTVSHSPQMAAYQRAQARDFVARYDLRGQRVIEIGCGDGFYLSHLRDEGMEPVGIEPSASFRELATARGLTCYAGYVERETPPPGGPYDAFVTRQVFEHVPDPRNFLLGIRAGLRPGGVGLVEVPNLEQALEFARFYDFFPDHLNYYSQRTLRYALESTGFTVEAIERGMNGEYNVAYVRLAPLDRIGRFNEVTQHVVNQLQTLCREARRQNKRIAVWGAGAKGITSMAVAQAEGIEYVIDSDPHKLGLFTPVSHLEVVAPKTLQNRPVDMVVVTALAYRNEIIAQLRETVGYRGEIAVLGPQIERIAATATSTKLAS